MQDNPSTQPEQPQLHPQPQASTPAFQQPPTPAPVNSNKHLVLIIAGIVGGILLLLLFAVGIWIGVRAMNKTSTRQSKETSANSLQASDDKDRLSNDCYSFVLPKNKGGLKNLQAMSEFTGKPVEYVKGDYIRTEAPADGCAERLNIAGNIFPSITIYPAPIDNPGTLSAYVEAMQKNLADGPYAYKSEKHELLTTKQGYSAAKFRYQSGSDYIKTSFVILTPKGKSYTLKGRMVDAFIIQSYTPNGSSEYLDNERLVVDSIRFK